LSDLTYTNSAGNTVYTSQFLLNRKTCCQTTCLHCPYGYTTKTHGLEFNKVEVESIETAQGIVGSLGSEQKSVSQSLLDSAFGTSKKKKKVITESNMSNFLFVLIKGVVCGVLEIGKLQGLELFLMDHFKNQDLTLDSVNSYYIKQS